MNKEKLYTKIKNSITLLSVAKTRISNLRKTTKDDSIKNILKEIEEIIQNTLDILYYDIDDLLNKDE